MCLSKGLSAVKQAIDKGVLPNKLLGFVPTAGDTYENPYFVEESRTRLRSLGIKLVELDLASETSEELKQKLESVDGVYVAGGNTFFLLYHLQQKQLYKLIIERVKAGLPYFGESAGAVLLATSIEPAKPIDDPGDAPQLKSYEGLGLINFFPLPHVDKEKYKSVFDQFMNDNQDSLTIVRYRDDQAVLTRDGSNYEILPSSITEIS